MQNEMRTAPRTEFGQLQHPQQVAENQLGSLGGNEENWASQLSKHKEREGCVYIANDDTIPIFLPVPSCFTVTPLNLLNLSSNFKLSDPLTHPSTYPTIHLSIHPLPLHASIHPSVNPSESDFPLRCRAHKAPQGGALSPLSVHFSFPVFLFSGSEGTVKDLLHVHIMISSAVFGLGKVPQISGKLC